MRTFKDLFKQTRRAVLTAFWFSGMSALLLLLVPLYSHTIFSAAIPTYDINYLFVLSGLLIGAILVIAILEAVRNAILLRAAVWLDHVLGQLLFENSLKCARDTIDTRRNLAALTTYRNYLTSAKIGPVLDAAWVVLFLAAIVLVHPLLGQIAIAGTISLALTAAWQIRYFKAAHAKKIQSNRNRLDFETDLGRIGSNARALGFSFGASTMWERLNRGQVAGTYQLGKTAFISRALAKGLRQVTELAILGTAAALMMAGTLDVGGLIVALILSSRALGPMQHISANINELLEIRYAILRLKRLSKRSIMPQSDCAADTKPAGHLAMSGVSFTYPHHTSSTLRHIDLDLEAGQCLIIAGPAGAGKSTFAALIAGTHKPSSGRITLDGQTLNHWQMHNGPAPIGYAPDEPIIITGSVYQNIVRFSDDALLSAAHAAMNAGVYKILHDLPYGLETKTGPAGNYLSWRERRAISLARAVHGQPVIIVLDTPELGMCDSEIEALVQTIKTLKEAGIGLVMATNEIRLQRLADHAVLLNRGFIVEQGPAEDILDLVERIEPWLDANATLSGYEEIN